MKRWVVRRPFGEGNTAPSDITVRADWMEIDHGALVFYFEDERHSDGTVTYAVIRAFGLGQWRDVEPLAEPPEVKRGIPRSSGPAFA